MNWFWFVFAILLLVVEGLTAQLVCIWFSLSGFAVAVTVSLFPKMGVVWQVVLFVVLSGVLLLSTRGLVKKLLARKKSQETNLELVVGHDAVVTEEIDNVHGQGTVKINGLEWSARSLDERVIAKGEIVRVVQINGNKAIVERK
ncbi:MAG: NfeD family protein [Clostridia bacterium]|nr:NfeD family protein [Clostridia bacterium]